MILRTFSISTRTSNPKLAPLLRGFDSSNKAHEPDRLELFVEFEKLLTAGYGHRYLAPCLSWGGTVKFPYKWNDASAKAFAQSVRAELADKRGSGSYSLSPAGPQPKQKRLDGVESVKCLAQPDCHEPQFIKRWQN
jgi:hypothetical protein